MDRFEQFWNEQAAWSQEVFGPDNVRGPLGPTKHLAKEVLCELLWIPRPVVDEFLRNELNGVPSCDLEGRMSLKEFVDCLFLVVDACRRDGHSCEQLTQALFDKLEENKAREWPKFDPKNVNEAVEHIRKPISQDSKEWLEADDRLIDQLRDKGQIQEDKP